MKIKKKFVVIIILSLLFIGLGTVAFNAFKPKNSPNNPTQDLNNPDFQNKTLEKPVEGDAFSVDPLDSLFIAIGVLRNKEYYQVKTSGENKALSVTQELKGEKYVRGNELLYRSVSKGIKIFGRDTSVGKQIYITPDDYIVRDAKNVLSVDEVIWNDEANNFTKDDFLLMYGTTFFDFTQYILNEKSIKSAEVVLQSEHFITITYILDIEIAPEAYRREVRTMSGSNALPSFENAKITVTMNKDWEILETVTEDTYYVNILGDIKTTGRTVNIFSYDDIEIPDRDYFEVYFGKDTSDLVEKEKTALDYLMSALAPITSNEGFNFKADVVINDYEMEVSGFVNINPLNILLNVDDYLYLEFDGDKWYVQYDELIGSVSSQTIKDILNFELNEEALLEIFDSDKFDLMEDTISFSLKGTSVFVTIDLDFGNIIFEISLLDNSIQDVSANLNLGNQEISLSLKLIDEQLVTPIEKNQAVSLDKIFIEFYEMALSPNFNVDIDYFEIGNELIKVGIKGNLFVSLDGGIKIDGAIDVYQDGKHYEINIKVIDDEIYLSVFNLIDFKMTFDDIPDMLLLLNDVFGFEFDVEDLQKYSELIIDKDLIELFSNTKLSFENNKLLVELFVNDNFLPLNITYFNKKAQINLPANAVVNIKHTNQTKEIDKPNKPFIEFADLAARKDLILAILDFIDHDGYQIDFNFEYDDISLLAKAYIDINEYSLYMDGEFRYDQLVVPFEVSFVNEVLKFKASTLELELTLDDILYLLSDYDLESKQLILLDDIVEILSSVVFGEDFINLDFLEHLLSYDISNPNEITITGKHLNASLSPLDSPTIIHDLELLSPIDLDGIKTLINLGETISKTNYYEALINFKNDDLEFEGSLIVEVNPELKVYAQGLLTYERMQLAFEASYYNDVVKVKAGTIEVELTIGEIMSLIKSLDIDLEETLPLISEFDFELIFTILETLVIDANHIYLEAFGLEISYLLENPKQLFVTGSGLEITINALDYYNGSLELDLVDPLTKVEVDEILLAVNNFIDLINGQKVQYHLTGLIVGQFEIEGYIKLATSNDSLDVEAHVLVTSLSNPDEKYDVSLMSLDGYTYISYNGLNIYAPTEDINKTLKTVLQVMGIEIGLIDSILDVEIGSFDNVFAPYLPDNDSVIDILSFVSSIKLVNSDLVISLNKEAIYDYPVEDNLEIIINQTTDLINYIKVNNAYISETDKLELLLESGDLDFEIIASEDLSDYHHLEGISTLIEQFFKTAELKNYELTGELVIKLRILGLNLTNVRINDVNLKVVLDDNYQPTLVTTFTMPYFVGVTNNKTEVTLYLTEDGVIHLKQYKHRTSIFSSNKTEYRSWTQEEFEDDLMENIFLILNLANLTKNQIRDAINAAEGHVIKPEKLLRSYKYHNDNHYNLVIVGQELNGDPNLGDITINIKSNEEGHLNYFDLALKVMGDLLDISGQFNHVNIGQTIIINYPDFNTNW